MIELMETPTFVVDDFFDAKNVRLFNYFDAEQIPYEVLELCSADLPYRTSPYYPVIIKDLHEDIDIFEHVNPRAIAMAQDEHLILVFIYEGHKNISDEMEGSLLTQMMRNHISFDNIRVVTSVKPLSILPPYIYFSFAEMEAYLSANNGELYVDGFCETERQNVFTCNVDKDTAHARLLCASIWYHALNNFSYFNYAEQSTSDEIFKSPVYHWNEHWSATATLMDMFGQQLPIVNEAGSELDYYNNAYWNFAIMPSFTSKQLSIGPNVFKPILNLQPFIIVGPPGSLTVLKSMGYQTFSEQVNEAYDKVGVDESRMQTLFRLIYEISHFTGSEFDELNAKLRNTIIHNQKHLLAPKKHKLITLLNSLRTRSQ